jgi:hypothetical protein
VKTPSNSYLLLTRLLILDIRALGSVKMLLVGRFYQWMTHFVDGVLVVSVTFLMITRILVFGWYAHLNLLKGTPVGCLATSNVPFNMKKWELLIMDN